MCQEFVLALNYTQRGKLSPLLYLLSTFDLLFGSHISVVCLLFWFSYDLGNATDFLRSTRL